MTSTRPSSSPSRSTAPSILGDRHVHHLRDVSYDDDASQIRTGSGPQAMAALRNLAIGILKTAGHTSIAAACRHHARDATRTLETLGLDPA